MRNHQEMKVTSFALAMLLLAALWVEAHSFSFDRKAITCCYKDNFTKKPIAQYLIKSDRLTSTGCSRQAVIVLLRQGREVCVDPNEKWFKKYKESKKNSSEILSVRR